MWSLHRKDIGTGRSNQELVYREFQISVCSATCYVTRQVAQGATPGKDSAVPKITSTAFPINFLLLMNREAPFS